MQLKKETFLSLQPVEKIKRTPVNSYSGLYCEQNQTGYTFQLKYKSPETGQFRFMKLVRYKYGDNINKKMLDNMLKQMVINQGLIAQGIDILKRKHIEKEKKSVKKKKTVNQVFDSYTETYHFNQLAPNSQKAYLTTYRLYVAKPFGERDVSSLKRSEIKNYLDKMRQDGAHNSTLNCFQIIQLQAIDDEEIETPFAYSIKFRAVNKKDKVLTDEEISALMLSNAGYDSLRNIAKMQLLTGCRNGEVSGMRWEEIDMKNKVWIIPPERVKTEKGFKKMNRPHILPLMPKISEILLQQRQHSTTGLVFPKLQSRRSEKPYYHSSAVSRWLREELGINSGTHQLRHTAGTHTAETSGMSEYDVKIILNHAVEGNTGTYINTQQMERKREIYSKWHNYIEQLINPVKMVSGGVR